MYIDNSCTKIMIMGAYLWVWGGPVSEYKGYVRSNILVLSPVMYFPVCLSPYLSMKFVASAGFTLIIMDAVSNSNDPWGWSTLIEHGSQHCFCHQRAVWRIVQGLITQDLRYEYRLAGSICSPYNPHTRNWWTEPHPGLGSRKVQVIFLEKCASGCSLCSCSPCILSFVPHWRS
jgi:hypothetical protein